MSFNTKRNIVLRAEKEMDGGLIGDSDESIEIHDYMIEMPNKEFDENNI